MLIIRCTAAICLSRLIRARAFVLDAIKFPVIQKAGSARFDRPYEIPEFAIQEAIVNAVAHRNYNNTSGVQVMVFVDRVEVWNSGSLPPELTVERFKETTYIVSG